MISRDSVYAVVSPENIDLLTKFIEGYDHLGIVSTIDAKEGLIVVRCTEDTVAEIRKILSELPFKVHIK